MSLYKNKFRIESTRLNGWNYANGGLYFVTICTKNRFCTLGEIIEQRVALSEIGVTSERFWMEIPVHFPQVQLDSFVVMPNHLHGIIILAKPTVETRHVASLQPERGFGGLQGGSLAKIVQAFKAATTRWSRANGHTEFGWQAGFYDHLIRNEKSLKKIQDYIISNPASWDEDEENPEFRNRE